MEEQGGAKTGFKRLTATGLLQSCRSISFLFNAVVFDLQHDSIKEVISQLLLW